MWVSECTLAVFCARGNELKVSVREKHSHYPPSPLICDGFGDHENFLLLPPPPTESRRLLEITEKTQEIPQAQLGSSANWIETVIGARTFRQAEMSSSADDVKRNCFRSRDRRQSEGERATSWKTPTSDHICIVILIGVRTIGLCLLSLRLLVWSR